MITTPQAFFIYISVMRTLFHEEWYQFHFSTICVGIITSDAFFSSMTVHHQKSFQCLCGVEFEWATICPVFYEGILSATKYRELIFNGIETYPHDTIISKTNAFSTRWSACTQRNKCDKLAQQKL